MLVDVVMPQLGESVVEGVVVKWLVREGDAVVRDQALLEISTDKVDAEIPSPEAGVVAKILVREGETVPVRTPVARIETQAAARAEAPPPAPPVWDEEVEGAPADIRRQAEEKPPMPSPPTVEEAPGALRPPAPHPRAEEASVRITPVVARMAAEHGLDLSRIRGTGIDGRVTKRDVEEHLAGRRPAGSPGAPPAGEAGGASGIPAAAPLHVPPSPPQASPFEPAPEPVEGDRVVPFTPIRKRIAEHMVASKRTSAHVHAFAEVDMRRVAAFRDEKRREGTPLTFLPFVVQAAVRALREFPAMNASVQEESMVLRKEIHVGVAVDTDRGLVVPVVRNADRLPLRELAAAMEDLGRRAKERRIRPDELSGGTFSVSNPGPKGNLFGTPIINQPQVGILRMGQVVKRPVVIDHDGEDAIAIRPMMYLALGYDHRVIDGVAGNGFLYRVREILEAGDFALDR